MWTLWETSLEIRRPRTSICTESGLSFKKLRIGLFLFFQPQPPPSPQHIHSTVFQRKGKARWFWGLATRKGPSFTSRLLLNSSVDWQGYRIQAIWELLGSLGPFPNEQVLTWKKLPIQQRCRHGAAMVPEVCGIFPSTSSHPRNRALNSTPGCVRGLPTAYQITRINNIFRTVVYPAEVVISQHLALLYKFSPACI